MVEKEFVDVKIGTVAELKLEFKEGKLVASAEVGADQLLDLIAAKIPGQIDDAILGLLKAALKA